MAKLTPQQQLYRDPPYRIENAHGQLLGHNTIGTTARHADGSLEYNAHNLYGLSEAVATHTALEKITGKRPFILTRWVILCGGFYKTYFHLGFEKNTTHILFMYWIISCQDLKE